MDAVDESTVFRTPLLELDLGIPPTVYAKAEWFNLLDQPYGGGSVKTRIALAMLDAAEDDGVLEADQTIIEPSSGNTGTGLARVAAARGYDVEIFTAESAAETKVEAIRDAGGTIRRSETYEQMLRDCEALSAEHPDRYYHPDQYANPANPGIHARTTGREIWTQTDGEVTAFVAGVGTGGTVTGVGRTLHAENPDVSVYGFEPEEPRHGIDGLKYTRGAYHDHPPVFDETVLDHWFTNSTAVAYRHARWLRDRYDTRTVGIRDPGRWSESTVRDSLRVRGEFRVGTSSGACVGAVRGLHDQGRLGEDDVVVIPLADRGDRYRHLPLYHD